jgi:hypothetical protein
MEADGWGLLLNEGTTEDPKFRVILKGSERWMERMAADLNSVQGSTDSRVAPKTAVGRTS